MRKFIIIIRTIFCLLCLPILSLEVRTTPPAIEKSADRVHYSSFAKRFSDNLKLHPPVSDCQVHLKLVEIGDLFDHLEISIDLSRKALIAYLAEEHKLHIVTQRDQDRYIDSFRSSIKSAAFEIFSDIKHEAIKVNLTIIE